MGSKLFFRVAILGTLILPVKPFLSAWPAGPEKLPLSQKISETNLPELKPSAAPEDLIIRRSKLSLLHAALLADSGDFTAAREELEAALDLFLLEEGEQDFSPLGRSNLLLVLQQATLLDTHITLMESLESDWGAMDEPEISPIEEMVKENLIPATMDPRLENLIEQDILNQKYDFPVFINEQVMSNINYLTSGKKKGFVETGLGRLQRYRDLFTRIFREEGLPLDLIYLGLIESNFNVNAYSRARAKGIWQFIEWTGRNNGLRIDWWVDERSDPEKSTRAACRYLKTLYEMFGDWYLVLAAYNSGEGRIQRILNRNPNKTYWDMCRGRNLPRETRGYVPATLAAIIIAKNPERFNIEPEVQDPLTSIQVEIPSPTDIRIVAETIGVPVETIKELNPSLRRYLTPPINKTYPLRVPVDTPPESLAMLFDIPVQDRLKWREHRVLKGETLFSISRKYGVSTTALRGYNDLRSRKNTLKTGQMLIIPLSESQPGNMFSDPAGIEGTRIASATYRVRSGDNLWGIARRAGITLETIKSINNLTSNQIKPGMNLVLKPAAGKSEATARTASAKAAPSKAAPAAPAPARPAPAAPGNRTYTVAAGDSAWSIARKFNIPPADLLAANGLRNTSPLRPGQQLVIPGGATAPPPAAARTAGSAPAPAERTHRVKQGDTLFGIAKQYQVAVEALKKANALRGSNIRPGDLLIIPN